MTFYILTFQRNKNSITLSKWYLNVKMSKVKKLELKSYRWTPSTSRSFLSLLSSGAFAPLFQRRARRSLTPTSGTWWTASSRASPSPPASSWPGLTCSGTRAPSSNTWSTRTTRGLGANGRIRYKLILTLILFPPKVQYHSLGQKRWT